MAHKALRDLPRPLSDFISLLLHLLQSHWLPPSPSTHTALPLHRTFAQAVPSIWNGSSLNLRSQLK